MSVRLDPPTGGNGRGLFAGGVIGLCPVGEPVRRLGRNEMVGLRQRAAIPKGGLRETSQAQ